MISIWVHPNIARLAKGPAGRSFPAAKQSVRLGEVLKTAFSDDESLYFLILDETGAVRRHINIFIGNENIRDLHGLDTSIPDHTEISIFTAISGG
jgi:molybdopterin converting factor small subunit